MELFIETNYRTRQSQFFLLEDSGQTGVFYGYDGSDIIQYVIPPNECAPVEMKPLLTLPTNMVEIILKAFVDAASKKDIATENENLIKGKLEAKDSHLEDMRKIAMSVLKIK